MRSVIFLWTAVAEPLAVARVSYNVWYKWGKSIFMPGAVLAMGLLTLASMSCLELPDSAKSERQIADEAVECMLADDGGFAVLFLGGKDEAAEILVQNSTRDQLIAYRDRECGNEGS